MSKLDLKREQWASYMVSLWPFPLLSCIIALCNTGTV